MEDQILIEIRKIKDELAAKFNYDVREMLNDAMKKQRELCKVVNLSKKNNKHLNQLQSAKEMP